MRLRRIADETLAEAAPEAAKVGRRLAQSSPGAAARALNKDAFRSGSPESDILRDVLLAAPKIRRLYGHSTGAYWLENAVRGLPPERYADLHVTTFGCAIEEETAANYNQILGRRHTLGQPSPWGDWPEALLNAWRSTNTMLPMTMRVSDLLSKDGRAEDPIKTDSNQLRDALDAALRAFIPRQFLAAIEPGD
jgi:hypothetical protein